MKTENTFILHPDTKEKERALKAFVRALKIKFEVTRGKPYHPQFVEKIQESRKQAAEGKTKRVEKENLEKFLGL